MAEKLEYEYTFNQDDCDKLDKSMCLFSDLSYRMEEFAYTYINYQFNELVTGDLSAKVAIDICNNQVNMSEVDTSNSNLMIIYSMITLMWSKDTIL